MNYSDLVRRGTRASQPAASAVAVGCLYYVTDASEEVLERSTGSAWESYSRLGRVVKRKTADESVTSSTTLQDDDHLVLAVAANDIWVVDFTLFYTGATAGDIKFDFSVPASATYRFGTFGLIDTATTVSGDLKTQTSEGGELNLGAAGSSTVALIRLYVSVSSTAGNVTLRWAQNASSGTATTLATGSYLIAHQIA